MKLYLTAAGVYAGTQQEAKADGKGWKLEEVPTSKYELIAYLNKLKHGRDGIEQAQMESAFLPEDDYVPIATFKVSGTKEEWQQALKTETSGEKSNRFEDEFEAMPIALKLHYAALAMEAARDEFCKEQPSARRSWSSPEALG